MEFWGVEVKPGAALNVDPGEGKYLHVSQASLGEVKKDKSNERILISVEVDDQKIVLGTLAADTCAQISYDLVFEKGFKLSHNSKSTSVHFCGYKTVIDLDDASDFPETDSESEEDIQLGPKANGKTEVLANPSGKAAGLKADASAAKAKGKIEGPSKADKPKAAVIEEEDASEDDDDSDEDESDDDEDMADAGDESDEDDEDESSDEEEVTPKKAEISKKRAAESASKTPAPEKKAKLISPAGGQKSGGDGKKGGHIATPHPAKQAAKTPANSDKSKPQTPKSGSVSCKSCSKTFNSENALQAHSKAKHSAGK